MMLADEALAFVLAKYQFRTVLDIGAGEGLHAQRFREAGKIVVTIDTSDHWGRSDVIQPVMEYEPGETFDCVWASHVLEHQPNAQAFLRKIASLLRPGGIFAITVPPLKHEIVGGHVSLWNAGLLLYNLVLAGFDCSEVAVRTYGYNISVVGRLRHADLPALRMDIGDIEALAPFFPLPVTQGFNGEIAEANWSDVPDQRPIAGSALDQSLLSIDRLRAATPVATDLENLLWAAQCIALDGAIWEFGVFQGKSLMALASANPSRQIVGFDSFEGLPEPWTRSSSSRYETGHFATDAELIVRSANVSLIRGFFGERLAIHASSDRTPIAMIHIDANLYSSAKCILKTLDSRIRPGMLLVFGQLCDWRDSGVYPGWPEGEWRALREWMAEYDREVRLLGRGPDHAAAFVVAR